MKWLLGILFCWLMVLTFFIVSKSQSTETPVDTHKEGLSHLQSEVDELKNQLSELRLAPMPISTKPIKAEKVISNAPIGSREPKKEALEEILEDKGFYQPTSSNEMYENDKFNDDAEILAEKLMTLINSNPDISAFPYTDISCKSSSCKVSLSIPEEQYRQKSRLFTSYIFSNPNNGLSFNTSSSNFDKDLSILSVFMATDQALLERSKKMLEQIKRQKND